MTTYNYTLAMEDDIRDYIENECDLMDYKDMDDAYNALYDELWMDDGVTGNASGSYTFNNYKAEEYLCHNMDLLEDEENASDKFWKLEERIKKDKKHPGVILELSKGNMIFDIVTLINSGVITTADLADFSDELKESVDFILCR